MTDTNEQSGSQDPVVNVQFAERYIYIEDRDSYLFLFQNRPNVDCNVLLPRSFVEAVIGLYVANPTGGGNPRTVSDIANEFECEPALISGILLTLGVTHKTAAPKVMIDRLEAEGYSLDEVRDELVDFHEQYGKHRRALVTAHTQKEKAALRMWYDFQNGVLEPLREIVEEWVPAVPEPLPPVKNRVKSSNQNDTQCIMLNDLHFGEKIVASELFQGVDCDTTKIDNRMKDYLLWQRDQVAQGVCSDKECHLFALGDFVNSMTGFTTKGTQIEGERGVGQALAASDCIYRFIEGLSQIFGRVCVHGVGGNHDYYTDLLILHNVCKRLVDQGRLNENDVNITQAIKGSVTVAGTYILYEHGASALFRKKTSAKSAAGTLAAMLIDPNAPRGKHPRVAICGDGHCREVVEKHGYMFIRAGAMVDGNRYATENEWISDPSQTSFTVNEHGVSKILFKPFKD
jgi:hypothetical protein